MSTAAVPTLTVTVFVGAAVPQENRQGRKVIMRLLVIHNGITASCEWPEAPAAGDVTLAVDGLMLACGAPLDRNVGGDRAALAQGNGYVRVPTAVPSDWAYGPGNASESGI